MKHVWKIIGRSGVGQYYTQETTKKVEIAALQ